MSLDGLLAIALVAAPSALGSPAAGWTREVEFARVEGESLTLDAYVPAGEGPHPAVVVVHGGGYIKGDKQTFVPPLFPALERAGLAIFTVNYRLAPKHLYPAAVEDVERALAFVRTRARDWRVDPRHIALLGESAGGHLVALAALRAAPKDAPAAVVAMYTAFDLPARIRTQGRIAEPLKAFLGIDNIDPRANRLLEEASPIRLVRAGMPPFLLVHGTADEQVPFDQSVLMCQRLKEVKASCELIRIEGGHHGLSAWEEQKRFEYKQEIADWLSQQLRRKH